MLKRLNKHLTLIFTAFVGLMFTAALGVTFFQLTWRVQQQNEARFFTLADQVIAKVMNDAYGYPQAGINAGPSAVFMKKDGQDISRLLKKVSGSGQAALSGVSEADRQALFSQARDMAVAEGSASFSQNYEAYYSGPARETDDKDGASLQYGAYNMGSVAVFPTAQRGEGAFEMQRGSIRYKALYFNWELVDLSTRTLVPFEIAIIEDLSPQRQQLFLNGGLCLAVWAAGVALLYAASRLLAKRVLRTTEDGLRRQKEFVAAASHELRHPLAVIRASLAAAETMEDSAKAGRFRATAEGEADRMGRLVDDLLLLAGSDAASWQLHTTPVDIDTLLISTAESYAPLARNKAVQLQLKLPEESLPQLQGDVERLRQILAILLDNALQYTPKGSSVTLSAKTFKSKVHLCVEDQGPGIPPEERSRIFERFYRIDKSRHDKAHFGLGLSVAQELAALHGGQLTVGNAQGGGAAFLLTLPVL